jgi:hypothetical protein
MTEEVLPGPSRRALLRKGLLLGAGAVAVGVAAPLLTGAGTAQAYVSGQGGQPPWLWCDQCQGLFYGPFQSSSWCPYGGQHNGSESESYFLNYGYASGSDLPKPGPAQPDWAWCDNCMGLFYGPFQGNSYCPRGGQHDGSESQEYGMPIYIVELDSDPTRAGLRAARTRRGTFV